MTTVHKGNFIKCSTCNLKDFCLPMMLSSNDIETLDSIIQRNKSIAKGTKVYSVGEAFTHLYAIRSGYLKSYCISENGEEQITGFHLPGEIVGLEALYTGTHIGFSEALETSQICSIPYSKMDSLSSEIEGLRQQVNKMMSQEITHNYELLHLLNQKNADEKIATFLLNISSRETYGKGLAREFVLPMTRTDIANYLGLALETVSRIFGKLIKQNVISVDHRKVSLIDIDHLSDLAGSSCNRNLNNPDEKLA
ncbi:UNVERIFIED_CONTAM: hypothetical protein GTU68_001037 [Idotea baltica]|nr:hypothetical protein [Idotea baltica]